MFQDASNILETQFLTMQLQQCQAELAETTMKLVEMQKK